MKVVSIHKNLNKTIPFYKTNPRPAPLKQKGGDH